MKEARCPNKDDIGGPKAGYLVKASGVKGMGAKQKEWNKKKKMNKKGAPGPSIRQFLVINNSRPDDPDVRHKKLEE